MHTRFLPPSHYNLVTTISAPASAHQPASHNGLDMASVPGRFRLPTVLPRSTQVPLLHAALC